MPDKEWLYPNLHENGYTYSVLENLHYIPHVHGGLECVYVLDGELCATIDEKNYTLKKGDICLIFPQVRQLSNAQSQQHLLLRLAPRYHARRSALALRRWLCTPQPDLPCRELFATHPRNY